MGGKKKVKKNAIARIAYHLETTQGRATRPRADAKKENWGGRKIQYPERKRENKGDEHYEELCSLDG